jgi:hypothetical protein
MRLNYIETLSFSVFHSDKGIKETYPKREKISFQELLDIYQSEEVKEKTQILRDAPEGEKKELKNKLPTFTPHGAFLKRNNTSIKHHNENLIVLDIDGLTEAEAVKVKEILSKHSSTLLATISPRGKGVKALILLENKLVAKERYLTLKHNRGAIAQGLNITEFEINIDVMQFVLSQACFINYDESLYYNLNAEPLKIELKDFEVFTPEYVGEISKPINDKIGKSRIDNYLINTANNLIRTYQTLKEGSRHANIIKVKPLSNWMHYAPHLESELRNSLLSCIENMYADASEKKDAARSFNTAWTPKQQAPNQTIEEIIKEIEAKPKVLDTIYKQEEIEAEIHQPKEKPTDPKQKYFDVLENFKVSENKVDLKKEVIAPQVAIALKNETNDKFATIGSLGDFSLWTGKPKVGKSYAMRMAIISALSNGMHLGRFKSDLPPNKRVVLYIDTEQSDYHLSLSSKRICKALNVEEPEGLNVYGFRGTPPHELKQIVEALIYTTENLGLVVLDGIVDLIGDIMNQELGQAASVMVGRWTKENNIHVMTVLHENKSRNDDNARGAIGTYLTQKAETVMNVSNVSNDKGLKLIKAIETRNAPPEDFYFRIDNDGNAIESEAPEKPQGKMKPLRPEELGEPLQIDIVKAVFITPLNAAESVNGLILHFESQTINVLTGVDKIKKYLQYLVNNNYLTKRSGSGKHINSMFYQLHSRIK